MRSGCEIASPSALTASRLTTRSNFVGCPTGGSAGLAPFRILLFAVRVAAEECVGQ